MRWLGLAVLSGFFAATPVTLAQDGNWTTKAAMPEAREGQASGVINGLLYVAGGAHNEVELGTFEAYDPVADAWTSKPAMPTPREHLSAGVVNGVLYALGGVSASGAVANVDAYDSTTNTWSAKAPMPTLRTDFNAAVVGNILYAIGGYDGAASGDAQFKSVVEAYDATTDTWTTKTNMPGPRAAAAVGVVGGKIYLAAGFGLNFAAVGATYCYDPATDTWTTLASIPTPRTGNPLGGVVNGIFYVAAGAVGNTVLNTVEAFDPSTNFWSTVSSLPTARINLTGGVINNTFYAVGGSTSGAFASSNAVASNEAFTPGPVVPPPPGPPVITNPLDLHILSVNEAFDPVTNAWTVRPSMPTARAGPAVAEAGGKIYVIGGEIYNNCAPDGTVEAYDPVTNSWTAKTPMLVPHRWNAFAATLNGKIYVVGGQGPDGCGTPVATVEAFDPAGGAGSWSTVQPMNAPRAQVGLAVIHDNVLNRDVLYAVGGFGPPNQTHPNPPVPTVEKYDATTNTWTPMPPLNVARRFPNVAVVAGKIYAIGGYDNNPASGGQGPDTAEEFDPDSVNPQWVFKTSHIPTPRSGLAGTAVVSSKIYVIGGGNGSGVLPVVNVYDPSRDGMSDAWTFAAPLPTARSNVGASAANNIIYAIGGSSDGAATVGQRFIYQITATNHPTSYTAEAFTGNPERGLPPGLSFDASSGIVFGTPTSSVDRHVTFTATNAAGTGSKDIRIYVQPAPPVDAPGSIVSSTCVTARTNGEFSYQILTKNTTASATLTAGGLPPGLMLDQGTGLISGTPTSDGTFGVVLGLTDGSKVTSVVLQLTVVSDPAFRIITSPNTVTFVPNQPFCYTMTAEHDDASFSYIGSDGIEHSEPGSTAGLPPGFHFDGVNKILNTDTCANNGGAVAPLGNNRTIQRDTITIRPPQRPQSCSVVAKNVGDTAIGSLNFVPCGYTSSGAEIMLTVYASPADEDNPSGTGLQGVYNSDCSVTVTATPSCAYHFVNWTENGVVQETSPSYTFTPAADRSLVANFAKISYTISTSGTGGTLTGAGSYDCGSSVTITASPDSCHTFVSWTENGVVQSTSWSYQFTASGDRSLVANFDQITYNISLSAGIGGAVSGAGTFGCGSRVIVTATPDPLYDFTNWTENGNIVSTSDAYTFTVSADRNLVANFTPVVSAPVISPSGGTFKKKIKPPVTITCANTGATIYYTIDDGDPTTSSSVYPPTGTKKFKGITTITGKGPHTVKAKGVKSGYDDSAVATANFTIN